MSDVMNSRHGYRWKRVNKSTKQMKINELTFQPYFRVCFYDFIYSQTFLSLFKSSRGVISAAIILSIFKEA